MRINENEFILHMLKRAKKTSFYGNYELALNLL
jgi:hypothetical protein